MSRLVLLAPLAGWSTPLEEVPDPAFAGCMLGDGLAIDPTGATLHAPCDGQIIALPQSRHAVTLRSSGGAEILMHVGIDTVGLGGEGFRAHVRAGVAVAAGEPLLTFDLDLLARRAKSLLTPVLLLEGSGFSVVKRIESREIAVGEVLMEIAPDAGASTRSVRSDCASARAWRGGARIRRVRVALEHGIHARPAAQIATVLKGLTADVSLAAHGRTANARSTVALMTLGVTRGDEVEVRAAGPDAIEASTAVETLLADAQGRDRGMTGARMRTEPIQPPGEHAALVELHAGAVLRGVIASRGLAVGQASVFATGEIEVEQTGAGIEHESAELERARRQVRARLEGTHGTGAAREIVEAHVSLLTDPELSAKAAELLGRGASAGFAWRHAIRGSVEALRALPDARLAERVDDLLDLERQVLLALKPDAAPSPQLLPPNAILVADALLPSQLVALDGSKLAGICLAAGGATSHVAILAAAMGIPALVALGPAVQEITAGTALLLDAESGLLAVDPGAERLQAVRHRLDLRAARHAQQLEAAQRECRTADGERIEVFANIGSLAEAQAAIRNGAEGCGLLRTEFLFLERDTPPTEAQQHGEYQRLAQALGGRTLTIRTLDAGGDKPIPYLPMPAEDNPALGLRGVRTSLWRPDLLREQLRAILGVRPYGQCRILLPMVTDLAEIRSVRAMLEDAQREIGRGEPAQLGVMIETPASALMADSLAQAADFFSIGTNDLTQYTLAMDRGHPELAARLDALHPAVLRLIAMTTEAARTHQRRVAVCGGLASDLTAAPLLIGLGVHELSAVPAVVPALKALIGELTVAECTAVAREALAQPSAEAVRALGVRLTARETAPESV